MIIKPKKHQEQPVHPWPPNRTKFEDIIFVRHHNGHDIFFRKTGPYIMQHNPDLDYRSPRFESLPMEYIEKNVDRTDFHDESWPALVEGYKYITSHPELLNSE